MATYLQRIGRLGSLKCLQLESWGVLRSHSVASFCTQAEKSKKTRATGQTEGPDDRATLLAYKTAVAFPVRLSQPGAFPTQSLGVVDPVQSPTATAEMVVAAVPAPPVTAASEPTVAMEAEAPVVSSDPALDTDVAQIIADTPPPVVDTTTAEPLVSAISKTSTPDDTPFAANGSISSSSSDSDSDSDSDSEDEKSELKKESKKSLPEASEFTAREAPEVQEVTPDKEDTNEDKKEVPPEPSQIPNMPVNPAAEAAQEAAPAAVVATTEAAQATVEAASVSSEDLVDSALKICTATEDTPEVTVTSTEVSADTAVKFPPEAYVEATQPASADAPAEAASAVTVDATEAAPTEVAAETTADVSTPVESAKVLVDCAPVIAEATGEELQMKAPSELSEEAAAVARPEPEEPFDNSTYKNYQHHSYTPFTFVDLDVEMAKFRLPQPSSGRPSPRY
uniref:Uncharacterized protein n=1 Tax=Monopterus albus TaxID=43700 RepID=A0A3Q3J9E0_MONAL|nr:NADH dehydrogenase [ubiquinone] flavoprotein 3, mitochondrial isoform X2 [Monopterus albus]